MLLTLLENLGMFGLRRGSLPLVVRHGPSRKHRRDDTVRKDVEALFAKLDGPATEVVRKVVQPHIKEASTVEWDTLSQDKETLTRLRAIIQEMDDEEDLLLLL